MQPVTVVTVFFARPGLLRWLHASLVRHLNAPFRLVVVDNARVGGRRQDSRRARDICAELGVEVLGVERDASLEARAGQIIFHRPRLWQTAYANPSSSHAYALTFAWQQLARMGRLDTDVCLLDSDAFLASDVDPAELLSAHEIAFVPQACKHAEYMWPGCVWLAGNRISHLAELEWWLDAGLGLVGDTGAATTRFLNARPELRVRHLHTKRLTEAPSDMEHAPEEILDGAGRALAIHFRAGSGWNGASRSVDERKAQLVLNRVAWRNQVSTSLV